MTNSQAQKRSGIRTSSTKSRARPALLYIDLHLVHEVTSPQAFPGLRERGLKVRRPDLTLAHDGSQHSDHATGRCRSSIPSRRIRSRSSKQNCKEFGIPLTACTPNHQGIVHVIGPEQGADAARHDRGLRRQPHRDARSVRRAGVRHRHQRSGKRAGHAVPAAAPLEDFPRRV